MFIYIAAVLACLEGKNYCYRDLNTEQIFRCHGFSCDRKFPRSCFVVVRRVPSVVVGIVIVVIAIFALQFFGLGSSLGRFRCSFLSTTKPSIEGNLYLPGWKANDL